MTAERASHVVHRLEYESAPVMQLHNRGTHARSRLTAGTGGMWLAVSPFAGLLPFGPGTGSFSQIVHFVQVVTHPGSVAGAVRGLAG